MLKHRACMLLILSVLLIPTIAPSSAVISRKPIIIPLNVTQAKTGLEALAAVAEINEITLTPELGYVVEPTGHFVLFLQQSTIVVQDLATGQTRTFTMEPLCKPVVLDGLSEVKHILLVCTDGLIYYLSLENEPRLYGPYRLLETNIVGVKQVKEYIIIVHPDGLIAVYRGSLIDPYREIKLPIPSNMSKAYITQSSGSYTKLVAITGKLQKGWSVAVIDLNTGSIVYTYNSLVPLVAAYVIDAHSPNQFRLLTIEYINGTVGLELATIEDSKPILKVHEYVRLPTMPHVFLYTIKQSYMLAIVGGGLGHLVDVYTHTMLIKSRFAWHYSPTVKEYVPVIIREDQEYVITVDDEGLKLLDSSGAPQWYVAVPCKPLTIVYSCGKVIVVGCEKRLIVIRPRQEFFEKLALLTIYAPKLHIGTSKEVFIPTITVSRIADNISITVKADHFSLLLPPTSYSVKAVYEKLNIASEIHVVLKPPQTKVELPVRVVKYTICVKGLGDPLHFLPRDKPLSEATIQLYTIKNVKLGEVKTGRDGCIQINLPYTLYRVLVSAPGYRESVFEIASQNSVVFLEPKLVPLEVKVVDAITRHEIPNARVEVVGFGRKVVIPANSIVLVPLGTYTLTSVAEGYSSKEVKIAVNGPKSIEIAIEPLPTIIRVIDSLTGLPIDSFRVSVSGWTIYGTSYHISKRAQQHALLRLPPGYYTLTISAKDYEVKRLVVKAPTSETVKLEPKLTVVVERQVKTMLKPVISNPVLATTIIISVLVAVVLVKFRKRVRNIIEGIRRRAEEAGKAKKKREEVLEELRKLVEEAGV